jgi:hypothetical protein
MDNVSDLILHLVARHIVKTDVKTVGVLAMTSKNIKHTLESDEQIAKLLTYERLEQCMRVFIGLAQSKPPFSMSWIFMADPNSTNGQHPGTTSTVSKSLFICKQTPKNKNRFKSMLVYRELSSEVMYDATNVSFVLDKLLQCTDEALDCFKNNIWPNINRITFIGSCTYNTLKYRLEYEKVTSEMNRLIAISRAHNTESSTQ